MKHLLLVATLSLSSISANAYDPTEKNPTFNGTTDSNHPPIAVIDSGADIRHPLLKNNFYKNPNEIPGNGIDDDNNGYVDDVIGIDLADGDSNPNDYTKKKRKGRDFFQLFRDGKFGAALNELGHMVINLIAPSSAGHGTHVAGIIVQKNPKARILPIKIKLTATAEGFAEIRDAIKYALKMKAPIINMSLGIAETKITPDMKKYRDEIKEIIKKSKDTLFLIAAGNEDEDITVNNIFPGGLNFPNVICVGATDAREGVKKYTMAPFTNWGESIVDVYAPGVNLNSSWPGGEMRKLSGTSMATPFVAGVISNYLYEDETLSAADLREKLLGNALKSRLFKIRELKDKSTETIVEYNYQITE